MEQKKFRLRLNLFDGIVLIIALAVGAFLLWRGLKPGDTVQLVPANVSTVRYTVRFQRWAPGTSSLIQPGDQLADNVKNYEIGHVVSAQAIPARNQVIDLENRRYVWAEIDGLEDVLVTIESPCVISDTAITISGGYEIRVGASAFVRGEGYMGAGFIMSIEEVQG